jgi:hypothetical protein
MGHPTTTIRLTSSMVRSTCCTTIWRWWRTSPSYESQGGSMEIVRRAGYLTRTTGCQTRRESACKGGGAVDMIAHMTSGHVGMMMNTKEGTAKATIVTIASLSRCETTAAGEGWRTASAPTSGMDVVSPDHTGAGQPRRSLRYGGSRSTRRRRRPRGFPLLIQ